VLNKIIPDFLSDLRGMGKAFEYMKQMAVAKTKAPNSDYHDHKDEPPAAARQAKAARDYLKRAARIEKLNGQV